MEKKEYVKRAVSYKDEEGRFKATRTKDTDGLDSIAISGSSYTERLTITCKAGEVVDVETMAKSLIFLINAAIAEPCRLATEQEVPILCSVCQVEVVTNGELCDECTQ